MSSPTVQKFHKQQVAAFQHTALDVEELNIASCLPPSAHVGLCGWFDGGAVGLKESMWVDDLFLSFPWFI